ncbi:Leucine Rich Repeat (LRR)-containing protein [Beggiatoa alba B18LD]|uniref:non-specific serine/threonine protein kinase n=1 Tax=Beggiatoa alba B18LD TaxID=395493 RepID=I3CH42_9GAMM|nr:COR domain-containing protein [Beggiatoa alba]EIJ42935.1 Leucine Rich Repeat (LRR)-containing protein [Beggiatoa alba B18LD]
MPPIPKTPAHILKKIAVCREKQAKTLDLSYQQSTFEDVRLITIPPEVFTLTQLEVLKLQNNAIQIIPDEIKQLSNLKRLDLRGNPLNQVADISGLIVHYADFQRLKIPAKNILGLKLTLFSHEAPAGIFDCPHLTILEITNHRLTQVPTWLARLTQLTGLDLSNNQLQDLRVLETLVNLSTLYLSYNLLSNVSGLETLVNLSILYLSSNQLDTVLGLETLINLSGLDLRNNKLSNILGLERLVNLSSLYLRANQLSHVLELGMLVNLSELGLSSNQLSSMSGLEMLVNLSALDLRNNQLSHVSGLEMLVNLSSLDLSDNQLSHISGLETLQNLSSLDLSGNQLSRVSGLETLVNLSSLDLRENQLSSVSGLEMLKNLSSLYLGSNQLNSISGLEQLKNLSVLDLHGNQLNSISELEGLIHLNVLALTENKFLATLSNELFDLPKLKTLWLKETTITYPPIEQLEPEGTSGEVNLLRVRNYLRQLKEDGQDYLYEAKLLIVGEGEAGKTSLMRKITDPTYQLPEERIESTEGIDVVRYEFPYKERQFQVNIWDFGGQEIYHATHQFFLTKRALYLLVADNRKEDTDFYYWLNVVNTLSEGSPVLLVKNEKEERSREIDESGLRGRFKNFEKSYTTNLKTESKDYQCLMADIRHRLPQLPHIGTPQPKKWLDVRAELEKLAETKNYIDLKEYFAICDQHGFKNDADKLQLSETLHDLGTILHFQKDIQLEQILFLKPAWATQAVYHVLDNKAVKANFGKFTTADLKHIWHEPEYQGMHSNLLQLMLNFKLCYQLTDCQNTYIAPQLLPVEQPAYNFKTTDAVTVLYENYKFMPKGMLSQLIVALHKDIAEKQTLVWRNGVILERYNTRAEIIENYGARTITIRVVGQNRRDLLTEVMYELNKIHGNYHQLQYEVMLPCTCEEPYYFEFEELKDFANDRAKIQCRKRDCKKMVDARDLLEGILNVTTDNEGKTSFGGNNFRDIHGNVIFQQAGRDAILNQTNNTLNQGIQTDLRNLKELFLNLELGEQREKVEKLLIDAEKETQKEKPDKEEIGSALDRVLKLVNKTGKLTTAVKDKLIPVAKTVGEWLGEHGENLLEFFN